MCISEIDDVSSYCNKALPVWSASLDCSFTITSYNRKFNKKSVVFSKEKQLLRISVSRFEILQSL